MQRSRYFSIYVTDDTSDLFVLDDFGNLVALSIEQFSSNAHYRFN